MTKQILAFLFCFTRELNLYSLPYLPPPFRARTQTHIPRANSNPYPHPPPRAFRLYKTFGFTHPPIPSPSSHGVKIWAKKFHYNNKNVVTTKPTRVLHLFVINTQTFSELIHELLYHLNILYLLNILYHLNTRAPKPPRAAGLSWSSLERVERGL